MNGFLSFDLALLHNLSALCTPDWGESAAGGSLIGIMAMAGLAGGIGHCGPMCGIFVLAQVERRLAAIPAARMCESRRLAGAALPWYHLGRVTGYAGLGALTAWAGGAMAALPGVNSGAAILLALAALGFGLQAVYRLHPAWAPTVLASAGKAWSHSVGRVAGLLVKTASPINGLALGLVLSLLPCGLLYAALAASAASARPMAGALGMAAFALGTAPSLALVGLFGHLAGWHFRQWQQRIAPYLLLLNALLLGGLALKIAV